ncbi:hypothetical protein ABZT48_33850 [Streptomyces avermitilis]|uniref:hypothetical protein n=1 Tax=Streptomyces avermitilis TaxID=33903 RepID=UPI0033A21229
MSTDQPSIPQQEQRSEIIDREGAGSGQVTDTGHGAYTHPLIQARFPADQRREA